MTMFGQQASSSAINRPFFSFPYPSFFKKMLYCLSSFFHTQLSFSQCVYRFFIYIPLIHPINNLVYSPIYFVTFLSTCTDIFLLISSHTIPSPSVYITACSWASAMRCDKSLHALKKKYCWNHWLLFKHCPDKTTPHKSKIIPTRYCCEVLCTHHFFRS